MYTYFIRSPEFHHERPKKPTSLGGLFADIKKLYPDLAHDENAFIESAVKELDRDAIRTRSTQMAVREQGMEFAFPHQAPLNDFLEGARQYLIDRGIPERKLSMLGFLYG